MSHLVPLLARPKRSTRVLRRFAQPKADAKVKHTQAGKVKGHPSVPEVKSDSGDEEMLRGVSDESGSSLDLSTNAHRAKEPAKKTKADLFDA